MTDTEMPETIWAFKGAKKGTIIIDTIPDANTAYRLKSTVDAERAEDSKTIRELAAMLRIISQISENTTDQRTFNLTRINRGSLNALSDNAQRIGEAREGAGDG